MTVGRRIAVADEDEALDSGHGVGQLEQRRQASGPSTKTILAPQSATMKAACLPVRVG